MAVDSRQRTTDLLGGGTLPYHGIPKLLDACARRGVLGSINCAGVAEFNRAVNTRPLQLARNGIIDVSPPIAAIQHAIGMAADDVFADATRHAWEPLANQMADKVVAAHQRRRLLGGQVLWFEGMRTGHGHICTTVLGRLHERIPDAFIIIKTNLPGEADQRPKSVIGYQLYHRLHADKVATVSLLTDNRSPFALAMKLTLQDRYEAEALASLVAAQPQISMNRALAEIGRSLGEVSPFASWSIVSRPLEPERELPGWRVLRGLSSGLPLRGSGNTAHLVREAQLATEQTFTDRTSFLLDEPPVAGAPCYLLYTVPLSLRDRVAWEGFSSELKRWLSATYPQAVPLFVSGAGTPDPRFRGSYWCTVANLHSIAPLPKPVQEALKLKGDTA